MSFTKLCKRASITFFVAIVACLIINATYIKPFEMAIIIFLTGLLCIVVYALGDIVESLRCISTIMVQQDLKNESKENISNIKDEKSSDNYDFEKVKFKF